MLFKNNKHPDYDLTLDKNKDLKEIFAFGGLPYFILIDPKGNFAGRDLMRFSTKLKQL